MALDPSERRALQQFATDLFDARADLDHERECIDRGRERLGEAIHIVTSKASDAEKMRNLCALIDEARDILNERRTK